MTSGEKTGERKPKKPTRYSIRTERIRVGNWTPWIRVIQRPGTDRLVRLIQRRGTERNKNRAGTMRGRCVVGVLLYWRPMTRSYSSSYIVDCSNETKRHSIGGVVFFWFVTVSDSEHRNCDIRLRLSRCNVYMNGERTVLMTQSRVSGHHAPSATV